MSNNFNLTFSEDEIEALISALNFASNAASVLAHQEMTKGSGAVGAAKMNKIAQDARVLYEIVIQSINIGEPPTDERH